MAESHRLVSDKQAEEAEAAARLAIAEMKEVTPRDLEAAAAYLILV